MVSKKRTGRALVILGIIFSGCAGVEAQTSADWKPPVMLDSEYEELFELNPFNRKTTEVIEEKKDPEFAKDWALAGISVIGDKKRVLLVNKKTRKYDSIYLGKEGRESGISLLQINTDPNRENVTALVEKGGLEAEVKFDSKAIPAAKSNRNSSIKQKAEENAAAAAAAKKKAAAEAAAKQRQNGATPPKPRGGSRIKTPDDIYLKKK